MKQLFNARFYIFGGLLALLVLKHTGYISGLLLDVIFISTTFATIYLLKFTLSLLKIVNNMSTSLEDLKVLIGIVIIETSIDFDDALKHAERQARVDEHFRN